MSSEFESNLLVVNKEMSVKKAAYSPKQHFLEKKNIMKAAGLCCKNKRQVRQSKSPEEMWLFLQDFWRKVLEQNLPAKTCRVLYTVCQLNVSIIFLNMLRDLCVLEVWSV